MEKLEKIPKVETKNRKCLMCRRSFLSEGPHNRICRKCKRGRAYRERQASLDF